MHRTRPSGANQVAQRLTQPQTDASGEIAFAQRMAKADGAGPPSNGLP